MPPPEPTRLAPTGALARRLLPILIFVAIAALVIEGGRRFAEGLDYSALVQSLRHTPWPAILGAVAATTASFFCLVARDVAVLRIMRIRAPWPALLIAGFCGAALSNAVGLGGFTGAAVRYRIYAAVGLRAEAIARVVVSMVVGFTVGLVVSGAAAALIEAPALAAFLALPEAAIRGAALIALVAAAALVLALRGRTLTMGEITLEGPSAESLMAQLALTALYLVTAAWAFWSLMPTSTLNFAGFLPLFVLAMAAGGVSHVPGGLGVFDAVIVAALRSRFPIETLAAALVAFRLIYFVLPMYASTAILAASETRRLAARDQREGGRELLAAAARLSPIFLAILTFLAGLVALASGATPAFTHRLTLLAAYVPLWTIETANFFASVAGVLLLFIAHGLFHRLDAAWWLALFVTAAAFFLALIKGLAYGEASMLAILFLLLAVTHGQFNRKTSLTAQTFTASWFVAIGLSLVGMALLLTFAFRNAPYGAEAWWRLEIDAQAPRALRAIVGASIVATVLGVAQLLRVAKGEAPPATPEDLGRAGAIVARQERSEANLVLMGDKSLMFSASGEAFLMYAKQGRTWMALFDPVGPRAEWSELIWRFVELAAAHGGRAAFYQARPESLPLFADAGLRIIKIGEEARVALRDFHLRGGRRSHLRYALKRGERDGMSFELMGEAAERREMMGWLEAISDDWRAARGAREKRFSVAAFEPSFLASQTIALVREHGRPTAFVTVMTTESKSDATVALMRQTRDASPYAMEYLFLRMILAFQQAGYAELSLGMAPLSGLASSPAASPWNRVGNLIWRHGANLYNFQGVRTFKNKFDPYWEPRYLAVSGALGPLFALADAAALINNPGATAVVT
ncbi:MAG: bifunctional lysylphosphatidylglycerol flippase/synthetase MprF [Roseiarcus sp.]